MNQLLNPQRKRPANLKAPPNFFVKIALLGTFLFSCQTPIPVRNVHTDPEVAPPKTVSASVKSASKTAASATNRTESEREKMKADYELGPLSPTELQKYAYELGIDPKIGLARDQMIQIDQRKKLRLLERTLDSQKERMQYSKVLPWLTSDEEKLEFLSVPSIEGRQAWINKNRIWARAKNMKDFSEVMEAQDIAVGMPTDYVKKSWGEPENIEVSGNSVYKNERWKYLKQVSTPQGYRQEKRYVYFEGGRVVGWETE